MIENFINDLSLKLFTLKSTQDILEKELPFIINDNFENEEELFKQMTLWKTILQKEINLNLNYEYYKDCKIRFDRNENVGTQSENSFNTYNLTEAAVKYAYYHAVLVSKSNEPTLIKENLEIPYKVKKMICLYCDNEIEDNNDKCGICESLEFEYKTIVRNSDITQLDFSKDLNILKKSNLLENDYKNIMVTKDQTIKTVTLSEEKWSCTECSFKNTLESVSCEICFNEAPKNKQESHQRNKIKQDQTIKTVTLSEEKWSCTECSFKNTLKSVSCEICFNEAPKNKQESQQRSKINEIKSFKFLGSFESSEDMNKHELKNCWFKRCSRKCIIINNFCTNCGLYQSGRKEYGYMLRRRNKAGEIYDVWICAYCYAINNGKEKRCFTCNNELRTKSNKMCPHCHWMNRNFNKECYKCKIKYSK